uniref:Nuclear receptor-binding factor 2 n=1 Tax=Lygus hesperus TaxID=30085 RepID=A0A146L608_LYGHE
MDDESPLYLAHVKGRSAENHMKTREYDAAVSCHEKASELLQQAMTLTRYAKALESLELQYHYHRKQTDIIKAKKLQHEIQLKVAELRKKKKMEKKTLTAAEQKDQELQWAILRTMEEADSLLDRLHLQTTGEVEKTSDVSPTSTEGFKHPKDDKTVMEELRTVNCQLRELVSKLLSQLESSRKEVETLRARLKIYEDNGLPDLAPLELPNFDYSSL